MTRFNLIKIILINDRVTKFLANVPVPQAYEGHKPGVGQRAFNDQGETAAESSSGEEGIDPVLHRREEDCVQPETRQHV